MMKEKRILLLGAYSMEVVECGGALLKNALNGGKSHAAIAFAGEKMQSDLKKSAEILQTSVEFLNMDTGKITASYEEKLQMIRVIRSFRPDIIITQDTEHCVYDLDPASCDCTFLTASGLFLPRGSLLRSFLQQAALPL